MCYLCYITLFVSDPSISFFISHNPVTVTVMCDITLALVSSSKFWNKNKRKRKIEMRKYYKISYLLVVILELNSVSEVQYKKIMIIGND